MINQKYDIVTTDTFIIDLFLIVDYITYKLCNVSAADRFRELVSNTIKSLETFPNRFPEYKNGIRKVAVKNYCIFYFVDEQTQTINLLHILYQGMDTSKICE